MTDPMNALIGLQAALDDKIISLRPCDTYPEIRFLLDYPDGIPRYTYAKVIDSKVQAIAILALAHQGEGVHYYQVASAAIESIRGRGIGVRLMKLALEDFRQGMSRSKVKEYYLQAIVSVKNGVSDKIARKLISNYAKPIVDQLCNEPAYQYLRKVELS